MPAKRNKKGKKKGGSGNNSGGGGDDGGDGAARGRTQPSEPHTHSHAEPHAHSHAEPHAHSHGEPHIHSHAHLPEDNSMEAEREHFREVNRSFREYGAWMHLEVRTHSLRVSEVFFDRLFGACIADRVAIHRSGCAPRDVGDAAVAPTLGSRAAESLPRENPTYVALRCVA